LWATRFRCAQILFGRRADSRDFRDDIVDASFRIEAGETARPVEDGEPPIGIFVQAHGDADIVIAMALRRNLEAAAMPGDRMVGADMLLRDTDEMEGAVMAFARTPMAA
jgi:hypothetical protein